MYRRNCNDTVLSKYNSVNFIEDNNREKNRREWKIKERRKKIEIISIVRKEAGLTSLLTVIIN